MDATLKDQQESYALGWRDQKHVEYCDILKASASYQDGWLDRAHDIEWNPPA